MVAFVMSFSSVQTWAARQATQWLNKKYDLNTSVAFFSYSFPNTFHLEEVYLPDDEGDTLIYARRIQVDFTGFYSAQNKATGNKVEIEKLRFYWLTKEGEERSNFQKFIAKFDSGDTTSGKPPFGLEIGFIDIEDGTFRMDNLNCDSCFNFWFTGIDTEIEDFDLEGEFVNVDVKTLSLTDLYRFDIRELQGEIAYLEKGIYAKGLRLNTRRSRVIGNIALEYLAENPFDDFLSNVNIRAELDKRTYIESEEIQLFAGEFPDFGRFEIGGQVNGIVNDLRMRDLDIEIAGNTRLRGDVHIKDPTHSETLFLNAEDLIVHTSPKDARYIYGLFSDSALPAEVDLLGPVDFRGNFTGYLNDFKTKGFLSTAVGSADADLLFRNTGESKPIRYKGRIDLEEVNMGLLLRDSSLGLVSTRMEVDGTGFDPATMQTRLRGKVPLFGFNNYNYSGISVRGRIENGRFRGKFEIDDPNLQFVFDGNASFGRDTSHYQFFARIGKADLRALNFSKDSIANITSEMDIDLMAVDFNKWQGTLKVTNTTFENSKNFHFFQDIFVEAEGLDADRSLRVRSNIVDANISGNYTLRGVKVAFEHHIRKFIKSSAPVATPPAEDFKFDIAIKNTQVLTEIFLPALLIEPNSVLEGSYASGTRELDIHFDSPGFRYNKMGVEGISLQYSGGDEKSRLGFRVNTLRLNNGLAIDSIRLGNYFYRDTLYYRLRWVMRDSIDSRANIHGYALQRDSKSFEFGIDSSWFNVGFQDFLIAGGNRIYLDSGGVHIEDLVIANDGRRININGNISDNSNEILRLNLDGFGMDLANYFIRSPNAHFEGKLYGDLILSQLLSEPRFAADLRIDSLELNDDLLGDLSLTSDWTYYNDTISIAAQLQLGELRTLEAQGYYQPDSTGSIDFDVSFDRFRLAAFNPLLSGLADNLRGYLNGNIQVRGNTGSPKVTGDLTLPKVAFTVSFLQTDYNLTGEPRIKIYEDRISFPDITLRDSRYGTEGRLSGNVTHTGFRDFNLDLSIRADELLALNTDALSGDAYYGTAFVSGLITLKGPPDEVVITADVSTQRETKFSIPLDAPTSASKSDYVTFIDPQAKDTLDISDYQGLKLDKGITLDFNIDINRSSEVEIIVDEQTGTKLNASGVGSIRLRIAPYQDMELYGTYTTREGEFIFSLENLVKRKFIVERGGTVSWNGSPTDALINITAIYSTRADPSPILSADYSGGRTPVNVYLTLSGELMDPDIKFDIRAPRAASAIQTILSNRLNEEDKMNQQVFSILAFNSFAPDEGLSSGATGTGGLEILTTQVSNYLNQITGDYEVTLNYQGSVESDPSYQEALNGSQEEVEVGVSKRFFNDRVTLNSSVGVAVGDNQRDNQLAGDFEIEYDITEDGRFRAKVFSRSVQNPYFYATQNYQQGVGIFYRIDFNTWREFIYKLFNPISAFEGQDYNAKEEDDPVPEEEQDSSVRPE